MNKIEAQNIKTGQKFDGRTVRAIHKLTLFGKPAVRLFCEDGTVATLSGTAKVRAA